MSKIVEEVYKESGMDTPKLDWAYEWLKDTKTSYINGQFIEAKGELFQSINPSNGNVLGTIAKATVEDVNGAVLAAKEAFHQTGWKKNRKERSKVLLRISQLIKEHLAELATLESLDNGMLYKESYGFNIGFAVDIFENYAGWTDKFYGETNPVEGGIHCVTSREPVGVCGQIVPWNVPLLMAAWKIAPALCTGNTVVLKPSSATSYSVIRLFELIHEENLLPSGVLNLVLGDGNVGTHISTHMDVNKLSFTGSTEVGKKLLHDSADSNLKTLTLELGGKSPNIIFNDVDNLDFCIERSFYDLFSLKGEKCAAPTRLFVQKGIYEEVLSRLEKMANSYTLGDPFDPQSDQGPQCSKSHMERILRYIEIGKEENARLIAGGERDTNGSNENGYFVRPTIFADVNNKMRIAQEEIFGPVLVAIPFETEEEAVAMANDSIYGLAAGLWTKDVSRAHRVSNKLDAGMVYVNNFGLAHPSSPFGGVKQSGWGREFGIHSLEAYTRIKAIWIDHGE